MVGRLVLKLLWGTILVVQYIYISVLKSSVASCVLRGSAFKKVQIKRGCILCSCQEFNVTFRKD